MSQVLKRCACMTCDDRRLFQEHDNDQHTEDPTNQHDPPNLKEFQQLGLLTQYLDPPRSSLGASTEHQWRWKLNP